MVSTPKLLSWINFSNWWTWISFYTLSWSSWTSIIPTIQTILPLEWFVVNNSTTGDVIISLIYRTNVNPIETLFQKTLNIWWNILWITTISNPFSNIGSNVTMSVDFTKNGSSNLLNSVNSGYTLNNVSSSVSNPEFWEVYWVFAITAWLIYWGSQDTNQDLCVLPESVLACALGLDTCPIECRNIKVNFNQPTMSYNQDVYPGTLAVTFYTGTLSASESIILQNPQLNFYSTMLSWMDTLRTIYFKVGNTVLSANPPIGLSWLVQFNWTVTISGTAPVSVYADIKDTSLIGSIKFTGNIDLSTFTSHEYSSNEPLDYASGSLFPITINIVGPNIQITNTYSNTQNVQKGDRAIKLADLKFSTTTDMVSKVYSFKANITWSNRNIFDGGQITVYNDEWTALVTNSITSGTTQYTFVLPNYVTVAKTNPTTFTLKLDQVPNSVISWSTLQLLFATGNVVVKDIITNASIYPNLPATGIILTVIDPAFPTIINQSYSNTLIKYWEQATIGNVKIKALNNNVVLKNIYFTLSGLNTTNMNKISSAKLYNSGVIIGTLTKTGNQLYITNIDSTIVSGVVNTYELKANISTINTSGDVLPVFMTVLSNSTFESINGASIGSVTGDASNTIMVVNEVPTIATISAYTRGNDVVYKMTLNSTKQVDLSGLKLLVNGTNLSGTTNGITGYLAAADINYVTTNYKTAVVGTNTLTFAGLAQGTVSILGTTTLYVILPGAALLVGSDGNTSTVRVAATDMDYMDIFDDNSFHLNPSMLYNYQTAIAGILDLLKVVTIQ